MNIDDINKLDELADKTINVCIRKGWDLNWQGRGCYLHLESSELIEALRGKGESTVLDEAADVLFCLMSITEAESIPFSKVVERLSELLSELETHQPAR